MIRLKESWRLVINMCMYMFIAANVTSIPYKRSLSIICQHGFGSHLRWLVREIRHVLCASTELRPEQRVIWVSYIVHVDLQYLVLQGMLAISNINYSYSIIHTNIIFQNESHSASPYARQRGGWTLF